MKKGLIVIAAAICLTFTACSGGKENQDTTQTTQGTTAAESTEATTETGSADTSGEQTTQPSSEVNTLTGTVKDAAMHTLVITGEDGTDYNISKGVDSETKYEGYPEGEGLVIGDKVEISYTGTLNTDAQAVTVKLLEAAPEDPESTEAGSKTDGTGSSNEEGSSDGGEKLSKSEEPDSTGAPEDTTAADASLKASE